MIKNHGALIAILVLSIPVLSACLGPKTQTVKIDQGNLQQEIRKQQELALHNLDELNLRLQRVAYPLKKSAHAMCPEDQGILLGAVLATEYDYNEKFRETASEIFQIDEHLSIQHILENSPAELAGLQEKDRITAVNGEPLAESSSIKADFYKLLSESSADTVNLEVLREDQKISVDILADKGCQYQVKLSESDAVNAYADGSNVIITKGMMRFAETNQELALVTSHELAHNVMEHIEAKTINTLGGTLLDIAASVAGVNTQGLFGKIGASVYSQAFENEADYVGLYIMSRAGLETENAAQFWRRMAVEHPASINSNHASTHPTTAERFLAIENTLEQIEQKKNNNLPLLPEMKDDN